VIFLTSQGSNEPVADHFLTRFANAYLAEVRDFVESMLAGRAPRVSGEDGLKALEIAVAAEKSYLESQPCPVGSASAEHRDEAEIAGTGR
jgi:predicted dehydrogenase